jgi:hypothetical protein
VWSEIPHLPKPDTKRKPREISRSADTQKPNIDFKFLIRHLAKLPRTPPPRVCRRALCFAVFPSLELVANDKSAMIYVNLGKRRERKTETRRVSFMSFSSVEVERFEKIERADLPFDDGECFREEFSLFLLKRRK